MADKALPSPEVLRQLLRYEPDTGKLFWLPRGPEWFERGRRSKEITAKSWNTAHAGRAAFTSYDTDGYLSGKVFRVKLRAHRVAYAIFHGAWPSLHVDHINGIKDDNRISNLRNVSNTVNLRNRTAPARSASGTLGVYWFNATGKWSASIRKNGKSYSLGHFANKDDAIAARRAAVHDPDYLAGK